MFLFQNLFMNSKNISVSKFLFRVSKNVPFIKNLVTSWRCALLRPSILLIVCFELIKIYEYIICNWLSLKVLSYMIYHQPLLCFLQKHVLFIIRILNENNVTNALAFIVFYFVKSEKRQQRLNYLTRLVA